MKKNYSWLLLMVSFLAAMFWAQPCEAADDINDPCGVRIENGALNVVCSFAKAGEYYETKVISMVVSGYDKELYEANLGDIAPAFVLIPSASEVTISLDEFRPKITSEGQMLLVKVDFHSVANPEFDQEPAASGGYSITIPAAAVQMEECIGEDCKETPSVSITATKPTDTRIVQRTDTYVSPEILPQDCFADDCPQLESIEKEEELKQESVKSKDESIQTSNKESTPTDNTLAIGEAAGSGGRVASIEGEGKTEGSGEQLASAEEPLVEEFWWRGGGGCSLSPKRSSAAAGTAYVAITILLIGIVCGSRLRRARVEVRARKNFYRSNTKGNTRPPHQEL